MQREIGCLVRKLVVTTCGVLLLQWSSAGAAERQILHRPGAVPQLAPVGRPPGTNRLDLAISLPLRNREQLTNLLQQLYDPASPVYHRYLTPEQFAESFGPLPSDYQAVIDFARTNGLSVTATHPNRTVLEINGSVADIERTLHTTLRLYQHPREARSFYAPDAAPSIDLAVPVLEIGPLDNYAPPHPASLRIIAPNPAVQAPPNFGSGPAGLYRGKDFRAAYLPNVALTGTGQTVGLVQFDNYYPSDIAAFETAAGLASVTLSNVFLSGFNSTPGVNNIEVALDIEMAISMAPGLSRIIVYQGGQSSSPATVLNRIATDNLAKQISCSWSWTPSFSIDSIFQQFAAQGQSFFAASEDGGAFVGAISQPSDDPYITLVGGTTLTTTGPGGAWVSETVWPFSGGGISPTYSIPIWQQAINMSANQGSTTQRNLPDVALIADNIVVYYNNGLIAGVGGTSCSAPLWAGFTALVNQQAMAAAKPPLGFINPVLYSIGTGASYTANFRDITTGNNTSSASPNQFFAVPGYDLCTGWGTPTGTLINTLAAGVAPVLQVSKPDNGAILLTWSAVAGLQYQLQYKTNLSQVGWLNAGTSFQATNSTVVTTNAVGPDQTRFYRVTLVP